jgi:hypothetical protein
LDRQTFLNLYNDPALYLQRGERSLGDFVARIRLIRGNARVLALNLNSSATDCAYPDNIVQSDGLIHRPQVVETVLTTPSNT